MTVSNIQTRASYTGDGSSTHFTIPFPFYLSTDITVMLGNTVQASGYTITGGEDANGNPQTGTVIFSSPPASNVAVQFILDVPLTQLVNLVDGTAFPSDTLNQVNDRAVQAALRLNDLLGRTITAPDGDVSPNLTLPVAATRANTYITFDSNGNLSVAQSVPSGSLSQATIGAFLYPRTNAETSAGVTPSNYAYAPLDVRRYGAIGNSVADDHVAIQAAFNVAAQTNGGLSGGTVVFPAGYTFLCNADITVPVASSIGAPVVCAQGPGWSNVTVIFGTGSSFGFVMLGTGATTGGTQGSTYNYAGTFRDMVIQLTGTAGNAFYINSVNEPRIQNCWIRGSGTNGCGAYFLNCLVPVFENTLVTGCGSSTHASVEFDTCTTAQWRGSRISGGVTTVGGLLIDRCTNFVGSGVSIESCGTPIKVGSRTESSLACANILLSGLELENPGNGNPYIDVGSNLSGSALVLAMVIDGMFASPSGTTSIPNAVQIRNISGFEARGCHFTLAGTPTACWNIINTNSAGVLIRPHRNLQSLGVPWVFYNGTQVLAAGPQVEWQFGVLQAGGRPTCTSRGLTGLYDGSNLTGATPSILINSTMGGYYGSKAISQSGATTVTSLSGGEPGMEIVLVAADANTTLTFGNSGGAFRFNGSGGTTVGANSTLVAGRAYRFINDGSNGSGGSCWVQV